MRTYPVPPYVTPPPPAPVTPIVIPNTDRGTVLKRASAYLAHVAGAIEGTSNDRGRTGGQQTLVTAGFLVEGFALSEDDAYSLMWSEWNPKCDPPWDEKGLRHKISDAFKNRRPGQIGRLLVAEEHVPLPNESAFGDPGFGVEEHELHHFIDDEVPAAAPSLLDVEPPDPEDEPAPKAKAVEEPAQQPARQPTDTKRVYNAKEIDLALLKTFGIKREAELVVELKKIADRYEGVTWQALKKDRTRMKAAQEKARVGVSTASKPTIQIDTDLERMHTEAIKALAADPRLYRRGTDQMERVVMVGGGSIHSLKEALFPEFLTTAAFWLDANHVSSTPDKRTCMAIYYRGLYPDLRPIQSVVTRPTLLKDGSVLTTPGYNSMAEVYYEPNGNWPALEALPETQEGLLTSAQKSLENLVDAVVDFPFDSPTDLAVWLAELLTIESRLYLEECFPMFIHSANVKGSGKGFLGKALGWISSGADVEARKLHCGNKEEENELEKRITSLVMTNPPYIFYDEVETLRARVLQMLATSRSYAGRPLGETKDFRGRSDSVFGFAGNNVIVGGDMTRRTLICKLASPYENPALQRPPSDYRHPERAGKGGTFLKWIQKAANGLHLDALNILRCYIASQKRTDRPSIDCGSLGTYEEWSALVPAALVWMGQPDVTVAVTGDDEDEDTDGLYAVLNAWWKAFGPAAVYATELLEYLAPVQRVPPLVKTWRGPEADRDLMEVTIGQGVNDIELSAALKASLLNVMRIEGGKDAMPTAKAVGYYFKKVEKKKVGELRFIRERDNHTKVWFVRCERYSAGLRGVAGSDPSYIRVREIFTSPSGGGNEAKQNLQDEGSTHGGSEAENFPKDVLGVDRSPQLPALPATGDKTGQEDQFAYDTTLDIESNRVRYKIWRIAQLKRQGIDYVER